MQAALHVNGAEAAALGFVTIIDPGTILHFTLPVPMILVNEMFDPAWTSHLNFNFFGDCPPIVIVAPSFVRASHYGSTASTNA